MPEGLKNASPTFCRMTKVILKDQMQRNVFTYIDDIAVARRRKTTQIDDLEPCTLVNSIEMSWQRFCLPLKSYIVVDVDDQAVA
jgi:hypothetical protein